MKKILFIINPNSGKQKIRNDFFDIINLMSDYDCAVTCVILKEPGDATKYAKSKTH